MPPRKRTTKKYTGPDTLPGEVDRTWAKSLDELKHEELRTRAYELYSLNTPISKIQTELKLRSPSKVYELIREAITAHTLPVAEEATKRLVSYAEAALTSLEPKIASGDVAAHRVANKWIDTLMNLYGVGPSAKVEVTSNSTVVHVNAADLPVMKALETYKVQNEAIEGELAELAGYSKPKYDHKNRIPEDAVVFTTEELYASLENRDGD